jgi:Fur family ferric uptake transcriptional regulator
MKCDCCGKLYNLDCGEANEFGKHILSSHRFRIDPIKTVFYGRCGDCQEEND